MSFDIDWEKVIEDESINQGLEEILNEQLKKVTLPSFIDKLTVTSFSLGKIPPEITIRHIDNPFEEFYHDYNSDENITKVVKSLSPQLSESDSDNSDDEHLHYTTLNEFDNKEILPNFSPTPIETASRKSLDIFKNFHNYNMNNVGLGHHDMDTPANFFSPNNYPFRANSTRQPEANKSENDIQFILDIDYKGDASLEITVNLQVNYPSSHFISLPIKLRISDIVIHSLAAVAYLEKSVFITFLCDLNDTSSDYFTSSNSSGQSKVANMNGGNFVDYTGTNYRERIDVIKSVKIDTEIGEMENNILRNVGKVEKFLVEQLRSLIRDEIAWPNWICLDLDDDDDEDEGDHEDENESVDKDANDHAISDEGKEQLEHNNRDKRHDAEHEGEDEAEMPIGDRGEDEGCDVNKVPETKL
ncbi:CIC11C00000001128 [Sungouiella intermedia]|uniref:Mitochondrial distribution and morphology protein 12 n=1 Tax=Sungouiella intermedia TaxID=45354 RepID=A0A1L0BW43_9ASCO|nr:CIC11C00000001128 [[Candida] intermedia]